MKPAQSIRSRLLIGILLSLVLILGVAAKASYEVSRQEAEEIFGARLATSARVLEALVARQVEHATIAQPIVIPLPRELEIAGIEAGSSLGHPYETKIAFQVWRSDGVLLARSESAPTQPFGSNVMGFSRQTLNGEQWQVFVLQSNSTSVHVAEKDEVRNELMHELGVAVMTPLIAGAALLLLVANLLVIYGLAPLRELAVRIQARAPDAFGRLGLSRVPLEVAPVVQALDDLLARVKLAFERERRFTDAAAHELRTPLSALKIHADNLLRAESVSDRAQSLERLRQGLDRVIKLAEQMLAYSRAQNDSDDEPRVSIRLNDAVAETIAGLEPLRRSRRQRVRLACDDSADALMISGEPSRIQRLIRNLLDNASRYAPDGSEIDVRVSSEGEWTVLSVGNPGIAIPEALRERVFEPYYRVPGSGSDGSGLGLAIVSDIAKRHGATVQLSALHENEGTLVTVRFPRI